jgi:hypothetical protein
VMDKFELSVGWVGSCEYASTGYYAKKHHWVVNLRGDQSEYETLTFASPTSLKEWMHTQSPVDRPALWRPAASLRTISRA